MLDVTPAGLHSHRVQADELRSFVDAMKSGCASIAPKEWGSVWTWLALGRSIKPAPPRLDMGVQEYRFVRLYLEPAHKPR